MRPSFPGAYDLWADTATHLRALATVPVFDHQPPDEAVRDQGYVIVDPDPGYTTRDRAHPGASEQTYRVDLRVCGFTRAQVINTVDLVRSHLRDFRPWPEPRWTDAYEDDAGPVIEDDTIPTDIRYSATLTYRVDG